MKDNIREMLDSEIADLYGELKELDPESDEYSTVKSHVVSLHKLRIDEEHENDNQIEELKLKLETERLENSKLIEELKLKLETERLENSKLIEEQKLKLETERLENSKLIEEQKLKLETEEHTNNRLKDNIKHGLEAAGIVLPLIFYAYWMKKGFEFEKDGTFTSTTFRGLFNRFRPTK